MDSTGIVKCGGCAQKIEPDWAFCPACGADNRPPERRPPIGAHAHDFVTGAHCVICGHKADVSVATGRPIANGFSFSRELSYRLGGLGLWGAGFTMYEFMDEVKMVRLCTLIGCLVIGTGSILVASRTTIDVDAGEVAWSVGLYPFVLRRKLPTSSFCAVQMIVEVNDNRTSYLLYLLRPDAGKVLLVSRRSMAGLSTTAYEISTALKIPFVDRSGMPMVPGM